MNLADKVTIKSGTITTDYEINLNGGSLTIEGGTVTSGHGIIRTSNDPIMFCSVTGTGTFILDTEDTAVKLFGGDVKTGLEGAVIVGKNGEALSVKNVDGFAQLCDASGKVSPYAKITAQGSAAPTAPVTPAAPAAGFDDVAPGAYYEDSVTWAVEKGITTGIGDNLFAPEATCTRAQVVTFIWRAAGCPEPASLGAFSDVAAGSFYEKAAAWAAENNMAGGDSFAPEAPCTRAMAVEFMWRLAGSPDAENAGFTDIASTDSYAMAVNWALEKKVTTGIGDNQFAPEATCTRAQVVTFLYRGFAE